MCDQTAAVPASKSVSFNNSLKYYNFTLSWHKDLILSTTIQFASTKPNPRLNPLLIVTPSYNNQYISQDS